MMIKDTWNAEYKSRWKDEILDEEWEMRNRECVREKQWGHQS